MQHIHDFHRVYAALLRECPRLTSSASQLTLGRSPQKALTFKQNACILKTLYAGNEYLLKEVCQLSHQDRTLICKDCGQEFTFTASEQDFFEEKGFTNEPQRCKPCRDVRKNNGGGGRGGQREMFDAVCADCGKNCKVPFQPRNDRPVYCSDCFSNQR